MIDMSIVRQIVKPDSGYNHIFSLNPYSLPGNVLEKMLIWIKKRGFNVCSQE